jgi:hypothetical protein
VWSAQDATLQLVTGEPPATRRSGEMLSFTGVLRGLSILSAHSCAQTCVSAPVYGDGARVRAAPPDGLSGGSFRR